MNDHPQAGSATILATSRGRGWRGLEAELLRIPPGRTHIAGTPYHRLGIHVGRPVRAQCRCDGREHRRLQKHGDIDVVPAGLDGVWEDDGECTHQSHMANSMKRLLGISPGTIARLVN